MLYFAADITLRAVAVATIGFAAGAYAFLLPPILLIGWAANPLVDEARHLFSSYGLGMGMSPGMPMFADYGSPDDRQSGGGLLRACCDQLCTDPDTPTERACCVRPIRVWLDTALRYFAFCMAPPVLDGLGGDPMRLAREAVVSTLVCVLLVLVGLSEAVPHPQVRAPHLATSHLPWPSLAHLP